MCIDNRATADDSVSYNGISTDLVGNMGECGGCDDAAQRR